MERIGKCSPVWLCRPTLVDEPFLFLSLSILLAPCGSMRDTPSDCTITLCGCLRIVSAAMNLW
jgi:hypothetical protein